nr:glycoside hydrolase family 13 protein [Lachnospiraceae bacterium]
KWGSKPNPKSFAGGDLKGITKKLSYLKDCGIDSVYLTPVFTSVSNHKYDISDYYTVDPQFGTNKDLKELVEEAHRLGMHIVMDAVFNHASENLKEFKDVVEKGLKSPYYNWFIVHGDTVNVKKCNYETFASCTYMPKLNTGNPEVQKYLIDIAVHYIKEYDIDGWRLDVSDEISHDFWRSFRKAVKGAKEDAVIIGENWHDAYSNLQGDQYDSIMNYAFTKTCLDYFATGEKNAEETAWKLNSILMRNKDGVNQMMLNLLDSHDTLRIFTEVGKDRNKFKNALALLYFFKGVPCIYYGTEILTEGGFDPDCRRCMDWDKTKDGSCKDIYAEIKLLSGLRKNEEFSGGEYKIFAENDVLTLINKCKSTCYKLYINNTDSDKKAGEIKIPAKSFKIFANDEEVKNA